MPISTIDTLLRSGGMLEVLGGLKAKKYEVFLDDEPLGVVRLEGVPAHAGRYEGEGLELGLAAVRQPQLLAECTIVARRGEAVSAILEATWSRRIGTIVTSGGQRFQLATAVQGRQETVVTGQPDQRLFSVSGGGHVGMRPVLVAPAALDGVEFQAVLALTLFHLISLENAFAIFGTGH